MPGLCGRKGNLGLRAQTKPNRKVGRSSWRFASREVASVLFATLGSKGQFSFLPSADSVHHLARFSTSPFPHFFSFLLGVAVLPPLEAEMMWLLCVERSFLFWSSFTSAWRHFWCLLSVRLYSSDHCQLRLGLCCEIYDPYAGMFWAEH